MKKRALTIKEVAVIAKVSPSAVSIAMNDKKGISEKTRKHILQVVKDLEYVPNQQARRLLLKYTNNIGILHEKNDSPLNQLFSMGILNSAVNASEEMGYNFVFSSIESGENFKIPDTIKNRDVDGIILLGEIDLLVVNELLKYGFPTVLIDEHQRARNAVAVEADYIQGATLGVDYLISQGHAEIAYIGEDTAKKYGNQTLSGFRRVIESNQIDIPISWLKTDASAADEKTAYACMKEILKLKKLPTAVFCAADIYAIGAIQAIKDHGFRVPEDISVMGMDNIILSEYIEPALTTVEFNKAEMGKKAIEILIKIIREQYEGPEKEIFKGYLIERKSVKKLQR